jgi:hypothetical protein
MCEVDEQSPEEGLIVNAEVKTTIITNVSLNKILRVKKFKPLNGSKACNQIYH